MNNITEILNSENTTINTASESEQAVEPAAAPVAMPDAAMDADIASAAEEKVEIEVSTTGVLAVPDEEKAIEDCEDEDERALSLAREYGVFSPARGMAQIKGKFDNSIYAIINEPEDGQRSFDFCQRYSDGTFSAKVSVPQSDLFLAAMTKFNTSEVPATAMRSRMNRFLMKLMGDYLGTISRDEPYNVMEIAKTLYEQRNALPVRKAGGGMPPEAFYQNLIRAIRSPETGLSATSLVLGLSKKAYYAFFEQSDMDALARAMGLSRKAFIDKLEEYQFLYLTPSSRGYQTKIRVDGQSSAWAYCIYKLDAVTITRP